jgi:hypothetical protein
MFTDELSLAFDAVYMFAGLLYGAESCTTLYIHIMLFQYVVTLFHSILNIYIIYTANVVPSSPILVTLMMDVIRSSETSVLITVTQHNIPDDGILNSRCRDNLKSYNVYYVHRSQF